MNKKLNYIIYGLSILYLLINFNKVISGFQSTLWSREFDLMNHASNEQFQIQVISIIMVFIAGNLAVGQWRGIGISKWILIPIILVIGILLVNTIFDFIRWMEINIFGGGVLLILAVLFILNFAFRIYKQRRA